MVRAVESAVAWFKEVRLENIREVRKKAPGTEKGYDKVIVSDPNAEPMWGRFYEIGSNRPFFCSRDGVVRYSLAEISYETAQTGIPGTRRGPAKVLNELYPKWKAEQNTK